MADDLKIGEETGYRVSDASRALGDPSRDFRVKVILLFMQGDYKAQALNCGQAHQGGHPCHWCEHEPPKVAGVSRHVSGNYGSYYPPYHNDRPPNAPVEPKPRVHHRTCVDGILVAAARDRRVTAANPREIADADKVKHKNGVKEWCPLAILAFFDVIWDFVPDMMHMVYNILKEYVVKTIKGVRKIKRPKLLKLEGYEGDALAARRQKNKTTKLDYKRATEVTCNNNLRTICAQFVHKLCTNCSHFPACHSRAP